MTNAQASSKLKFLMKKILISVFAVIFTILMSGLSGDAAEFDIDITGKLETMYDDNITTAKDNQRADVVSFVSIGLALTHESDTYDIEAQGEIFQETYWKEDEFNNIGEFVRVALNKEFTDIDRVQIKDTFYNAEAVEDFDLEFGRESGRYRYINNRATLQYEREINSRLTLTTEYGNEIYEVNRDDLKDSVSHRVRVGLGYAQTTSTVIGPFYQWGTREFDPGNDSKTQLIGATLRHYLSKRLYLDVLGGVSFIEDFNNNDLEKPYYSATLTNEVGKKTTAKLSFRKDYSTTNSTEDIFDSWRASVALIQDVFERLQLELSAFYGEGNYINQNIEDDFIGFRSRLNFELAEEIDVYLSYGYSQTDSNDNSRAYDRNVVALGVRFRF